MSPEPSAPACPICKGEVPAEGRHRPFCSKRCRLLDLGKWLDGEYVIPGPDAVDFHGLPPDDGTGDER